MPMTLTQEEFARMMEEFDFAGEWMVGRMAIKRATPNATFANSASDPHHSLEQPDAPAQLGTVCSTGDEALHGALITKN